MLEYISEIFYGLIIINLQNNTLYLNYVKIYHVHFCNKFIHWFDDT